MCRCCSRPTRTAAPDGALVDLVGRTTDEKLNVVGHLNQRTMLVRGQNNRDVWGHDADRVAVAVTEKAPFTIEIVQPQVPIVRNGSMQLFVEATRDEGFNEPISVSMLYNPNGIGSSGSIAIPADQTRVAIPLTANGKAAIGTLADRGPGAGQSWQRQRLGVFAVGEPGGGRHVFQFGI